ncbi:MULTISPECIES: ATP-binding cassette domain-containing protein [unclassified Microbacterium]|uniref:ATP-binding cassette domain-containing protein n=1 Tax=unclassified Microbacterium TaxID=2609290 RepID=UPI0012F8ED58|nr:ATP-binding cassette domain-containing protein [Microbacterium sp. MAH-37]MVQ42743.1 ATP-binding cassette domain-containing protein [Microbacterium sp. MAH-37]
MTPAIDVRGLRVSFGAHTVLDGLDLEVAPGEVFALLGPNGAGKTTAISVLTTLLTATAGTVRVAGHDVSSEPVEVRRRIALTGQSAAVDDMLTAAENLVMLGRLSGLHPRAARERADELLARFSLTDAADKRVKTFSGGMRRRLDLALSFVVVPEVLFLDEPTTGVDPRSRLELWEVIRTLADAGTTVFLTTQYLEEADLLADRVAILDGGRIVETGTPDRLKALVGSDTVVLHGPDEAVLGEIPTDGSVAGLRRALDQIDDADAAASVTLRRPTLDDVFLSLTGAPRDDARIPQETA